MDSVSVTDSGTAQDRLLYFRRKLNGDILTFQTKTDTEREPPDVGRIGGTGYKAYADRDHNAKVRKVTSNADLHVEDPFPDK